MRTYNKDHCSPATQLQCKFFDRKLMKTQKFVELLIIWLFYYLFIIYRLHTSRYVGGWENYTLAHLSFTGGIEVPSKMAPYLYGYEDLQYVATFCNNWLTSPLQMCAACLLNIA